MTILPGLYTDFRTTPPDAFRVPGHAVASFRLAPDLHLVAGVQHLQRTGSKCCPSPASCGSRTSAGSGDSSSPSRRSRSGSPKKEDLWVYTRGEYGGGRWAYKDDAGHADRVEYSDIRAAFGFEWGNMARSVGSRVPPALGFVEVGYVFDRRLDFTNGTPRRRFRRAGWWASAASGERRLG